MNCTQCDQPLVEGAEFCGRCGATSTPPATVDESTASGETATEPTVLKPFSSASENSPASDPPSENQASVGTTTTMPSFSSATTPAPPPAPVMAAPPAPLPGAGPMVMAPAPMGTGGGVRVASVIFMCVLGLGVVGMILGIGLTATTDEFLWLLLGTPLFLVPVLLILMGFLGMPALKQLKTSGVVSTPGIMAIGDVLMGFSLLSIFLTFGIGIPVSMNSYYGFGLGYGNTIGIFGFIVPLVLMLTATGFYIAGAVLASRSKVSQGLYTGSVIVWGICLLLNIVGWILLIVAVDNFFSYGYYGYGPDEGLLIAIIIMALVMLVLLITYLFMRAFYWIGASRRLSSGAYVPPMAQANYPGMGGYVPLAQPYGPVMQQYPPQSPYQQVPPGYPM